MAFVYIIQSKVNLRYYIGSTNNLERRLEDHNRGKGKYTRQTRPFKLMFYQEYDTLSEARKVEYKLKRTKSREIIEKIIKDRNIKMSRRSSTDRAPDF